MATLEAITDANEKMRWFHERSWSISGNKNLATITSSESHPAARIVFPRSTEDVSILLATIPKSNPVAVVCGGHSSSNVATWAGPDAVIVDMKYVSSVLVDKERMEVTVGGGATMRALAEALAEAGCALPLGTGDTVGVAGFVLNSGISGYFGRRLGLLSQRIVHFTIVLTDGSVKTLFASSSGDDADLFRACLGAGSAMGIVTSITLQMEDGSIFQTGGQLVVACGEKGVARSFTKQAIGFMIDSVFTTDSVSMEIVITSDSTVICTLVFYDTFHGDPCQFAQSLRDVAHTCNAPIVNDGATQWTTWFEAASALWPIIAEMKGNPLVRMDHCIGIQTIPDHDSSNIDFLLDHWMNLSFEKAPMSIIEIRSLGGKAITADNTVPSGNSKCQFFADMIIAYDGNEEVTPADDQKAIHVEVDNVLRLAREQKDMQVDFSATHSQMDDELIGATGKERFGGADNFSFVASMKRKVDPTNRFRFHPFGHLLD